jgi:hypothetical protein
MIVSFKLCNTYLWNSVGVRLDEFYNLPQTCAKLANMNGIEDKMEFGGCAKM